MSLMRSAFEPRFCSSLVLPLLKLPNGEKAMRGVMTCDRMLWPSLLWATFDR